MGELKNWIEQSSDESERRFRQVIHIILDAISRSQDLQPKMLMKGGVLMAIRYNTKRLTKDVDFSTTEHYKKFLDMGQDEFLETLSNSIKQSASSLEYGIQCAIQKYEIRPKGSGNFNFQTLEIKIGYASLLNKGEMTRLSRLQSPHTVSIDYSFNEIVSDISFMNTSENMQIKTYGEITLLAEKFRAILQQEENQKSRGQDIYDIYIFLLTHGDGFDNDKKLFLLNELIIKSKSRNLCINKESISSTKIIESSKIRYLNLKSEIENLPDFDISFNFVKNFYDLLPWDKIN